MISTRADATIARIPGEASRRALARVGIGLAAIVALVLVGRYLPRFAQWVDGLGPWGPAVFVVGYALAVVVLVPASVLTIGREVARLCSAITPRRGTSPPPGRR